MIMKLDILIVPLNFISSLGFKAVLVELLKVNICFVIFYGVSVPQLVPNDNTDNSYATVGGIVADYAGSILPDANIIFEGTSKYDIG